MQLAAGETPGSCRLCLDGELTIRGIEQIHGLLQDALAESACVEIDCRGASEIDLSFIQLVLAARKSAEATGKTIILVEPPAEILLETLSRAGFLDGSEQQT